MTDDIVANLHRLHRYAAGLHELARDAASRVPDRIEGTDRTGAVRVTLGSTAAVESVEVDYDWKRYLRPAAFGAAVVEAAQAAEAQQQEALLRAFADDGGFEEAAERLESRLETESASVPVDRLPPIPPREEGDGRPVDLEALTRDVLAAASEVDTAADAPPAQGVGAAAFGKLEVIVSSTGLVSCTADPSWVSQHTGEELTEALSVALAVAREDLDRATAEGPVGRLRGLLDRLTGS